MELIWETVFIVLAVHYFALWIMWVFHNEMAATVPFMLYALFQMKFAVIAPDHNWFFAERVRFILFAFSSVCSLCLYMLRYAMQFWYPTGILYFGVKDFAGGTVVHMSAGFAALAGVIVLGKGKQQSMYPNIPFVLLGTGMLWFGWIGLMPVRHWRLMELRLWHLPPPRQPAATMLTWFSLIELMVEKFQRSVLALVWCISIIHYSAAGYVSVPESMFFGFTAAVSNMVVNAKFLKNRHYKCFCLPRCRWNYRNDSSAILPMVNMRVYYMEVGMCLDII
jgi:Amt family ammonium transporter